MIKGTLNNYKEPVKSKNGGYKFVEDACRHSMKCKGCKYFYCADDEILLCKLCFTGCCYSCSEVDPPSWTFVCKQCLPSMTKKEEEQYIKQCTKCNKKRRKIQTYSGQCFSCYKKDKLSKLTT